ncbi:MAG: hypothetical protein M3270_01655 [Thermoproteota archaeon]|nr:hypothetical protein [Thermoproteota archaeon]
MTESSPQYFQVYGQAADNATSTNDNLVVDGIECVKTEQFAFHIHTKFSLTIDNKPYPIPAGIGIIPDNCIYWLHTHDNSGTIHIESPIKKAFTLGQFLHIWKKFNSSDIVIENISNNNISGTVVAYVNGTQMNNATDYRNIELKDQDIISLIISSHG